MTDSEFSVSISNAALSGLLYDCCNNDLDQIGFLIGKTSHTTETVITDTQEPSSEKQVISDILSTMPVSLFSFYDSVGAVDMQRLEELLGDLREQVVGWYICRRNSTNSLYLRECQIDAQLRLSYGDIDQKNFIVGVVTEGKDENESTMEIQYTFYTRNRNKFIPVKVDVDNLAKTGINFRKSSSVIGRFDLFGQLDPSETYKTSMPKFIEQSQNEISKKFHHLISDLHNSQQEMNKLKEKLTLLQPQSFSDCQHQTSEMNVSSNSCDFESRSPILNSKSSDVSMESYEGNGLPSRRSYSQLASQEF